MGMFGKGLSQFSRRKEIFIPVGSGDNPPSHMGGSVVSAVLCAGNSGDDGWTTGQFPVDFHSLIEAALCLYPQGAQIGLQIVSDYGSIGQAIGIHGGVIAAQAYVTVNSQVYEIDITSLFPVAVAGDFFGLAARDRNTPGDSDFYVLGVRLRYR
jgi:hypothetical protein